MKLPIWAEDFLGYQFLTYLNQLWEVFQQFIIWHSFYLLDRCSANILIWKTRAKQIDIIKNYWTSATLWSSHWEKNRFSLKMEQEKIN